MKQVALSWVSPPTPVSWDAYSLGLLLWPKSGASSCLASVAVVKVHIPSPWPFLIQIRLPDPSPCAYTLLRTCVLWPWPETVVSRTMLRKLVCGWAPREAGAMILD